MTFAVSQKKRKKQMSSQNIKEDGHFKTAHGLVEVCQQMCAFKMELPIYFLSKNRRSRCFQTTYNCQSLLGSKSCLALLLKVEPSF